MWWSFLPLYKRLSLCKSAFENLLEIMIKYTYIFRSGGIKECFKLENMSCIEISEYVKWKPSENRLFFGQRESVYKNQVEKLLIDEFAYALDETPGASKERLYKALITC